MLKIAELKEHIGEEAEVTAYLSDVKESSNRAGTRWMDLTVSDDSGTTVFKLWSEAISENVHPGGLVGMVVVFRGQVDLWQDRGGMNVIRLEAAKEGTHSLKDFFPSLSGDEEELLANSVYGLIRCVEDEGLRYLLKVILSPQRIGKMAERAGGKNHHAYVGGLLAHTVQVAEIAKATADYCSLVGPHAVREVNKDIVIAGALLHDIGKLTTLSDVPGKLSNRGYQVDTKTESVLYVTTFNELLKDKRLKDLAPLDHVVLSTGKDARPRSLEAIIVRNADMMSNQCGAYGQVFAGDNSETAVSYSREIGAYLLKGA